MEAKEERVTRHEGLLHNHKQEIPVETLCHRTFGERESFRIYILASVGLAMQVSMFGRRGMGGRIRVEVRLLNFVLKFPTLGTGK